MVFLIKQWAGRSASRFKTALLISSAVFASTHLPGQTAATPQPAQPCAECDHLVGEVPFDGKASNVQPGQVICLVGGRNYGRITFSNIVGTPKKPIIIRNCGGTAVVYSKAAFGVKFTNSQYFKLLGNAGPEQYGICITTEKGFYLSLEMFTSDFEIAGLEIAGPSPSDTKTSAGFAGIGAKTSPYQDCDLFTDSTRQAWVMRNISIHHNYIHHTGGEGLYIGHGFYKGRKESKCPRQMVYSHSIKGVRIYDNLIENVGFDGIQIKNADEDVKVYNNVIRNYGTRNEPAHNEGLFIGEGTTGEFYGNIVDTGTGNGCQVQGLGDLDIHDNVFNRAGGYGIYVAHGPQVVRWPQGYFNIHNNVISSPAKPGFVFFNDDGGPRKFSNNLIMDAPAIMQKGAAVELDNNILSKRPSPDGPGARPTLNADNAGIADGSTLKRLNAYQFQLAGDSTANQAPKGSNRP